MRAAVVLAVCAAAACRPTETAPLRSRVETVTGTPSAHKLDWCDVAWTRDEAPRLELPEVSPVRAVSSFVDSRAGDTPALPTPTPWPAPPGGAGEKAITPMGNRSHALPARPAGWLWLNVWATWCKPCVHEMPTIVMLSEHLRQDGFALTNWFLSVDEDAALVDAFARTHPELAPYPSYRLRNLDAFDTWTQRYGLAAGTAIPLNLIADPDGRVRCIRKSALADGDYPRIRAVLAN